MHISLAIILGMSLTFALDCALLDTNAHNSFVQQFIDMFRDFNLILRCMYNGDHSSEVCIFSLGEPDLAKLLLFMIMIYSHSMLSWSSYTRLFHIIELILLTISVGWLITRYCDSQDTYYKIDILTVHFIIWQFIYPMYNWVNYELEWPVFFLQQISCCISNCLDAYFYHKLFLRYLPFKYNIIFLWIFSFYDIYTCLYPHGRLYIMLTSSTSQSKIPISSAFYSIDPNDIREDYRKYEREEFTSENHLNRQKINSKTNAHNNHGLIGFGDFFVFNLMVLFILQPQWSLMIKILIFFGCIISVYIGYCGTLFFQRLWSLNHVPALPCPTVIFSMYCIFLNVNRC